MSDSCFLRVNCRTKTARLGDLVLSCRIGKEGFVEEAKGKEGDGKTPLGLYHLRWGFYRADKIPHPPCHKINPVTWRALEKNDGWSDDVNSPAYNRFIKTPSSESHEALWREDCAYDLILVISHNDSPPEKEQGSAVFIHIAQADDRKTLGCIAFDPDSFTKLLPRLQREMTIELHD